VSDFGAIGQEPGANGEELGAIGEELGAEDQKLVTLARSARARTRADQGAAIRDSDGRTYVASTVQLPSLQLSALQVAVAMAVSSGAQGIEAAAIVGASEPVGASGPADAAEPADGPGVQAVRDIGPKVTVFLASPDGTVIGTA